MPSSTIKHVFVLMLENRSFDLMLGGLHPEKMTGSNTYQGAVYNQSTPAPVSMTTDPSHELTDVLMQLTNPALPDPPAVPPINAPLGPYPRQDFPNDFPNGTAFVANYVLNTDEDNPHPPTADHYGDIMKFFSSDQLPVTHTLAREFAYCDRWFSSIPGPTWPNRFFLHNASSNGMDCSPTMKQITTWQIPGHGFQAPKRSIFQHFDDAGLKYRIYNDCDATWNPLSSSFCASDFADDPSKGDGALGLGWIPQVGSLTGIGLDSWYGIKEYFPKDLNKPYEYQYTFIEPHYGNLRVDTYVGGSSQHPMDDVYGGEALLKFVYETIRNSPLWEDSLLFVIYDEHGGFYDSVPPPPAVMPADGSPVYGEKDSLSKYGFLFDNLGVRIPALLISPFIPKGTVDSTQYDHSSVIATLSKLFGTDQHSLQLTERDKHANNVLANLSLSTARTDCPTNLPDPVSGNASLAKRPTLTPEQLAAKEQELLPESGNLIGAMGILHKIHLELIGHDTKALTAIQSQFNAIKTRGDLKSYVQEVVEMIAAKKRGGGSEK
ncbi:MAG: phosphoesterase [Bacteroidetes bacterium]|nr:phosphoesterase [Bacteroidota bacterium]